MIAVIFEVVPFVGERHRYLDLAGELRAQLEAADGFLSVERFESLSTRGKLLSLSFWRDEEAVRRWRETEEHRARKRPAGAASSPPIACASPKCCATTVSKTGPRRRRTAARDMGEGGVLTNFAIRAIFGS